MLAEAAAPAPSRPSLRLWVQLALLLTLVASAGVLVECLLLLGIVTRALERVPAGTAAAFRAAVLPDLGGDLPLTALFGFVSLCGLLLGVSVSLALALPLARRLAAPLEAAARAADQLSSGKLETRVVVGRVLSSELARLLTSFNNMAARLQRVDAARRYANAAIAHELRTPIAALRGRLAGIRDGVFQPSHAELGKLLAPLETLSRLADDLQMVMLAQTPSFALQRTPLKLSDWLRELVIGLTTADRPLSFQCDPDVIVSADAVRLHQAVTNVIQNALQHTPSGAMVRVRLEVQSDTALLSVADSGSGVPEAEREQIFEAFYRRDPSRSQPGHGLGLAVARAILESHGGAVEARPADIGGLEVRMWLPLA